MLEFALEVRRDVETLAMPEPSKDKHRLDREMDRLRDLGLLTPDSGFVADSPSNVAYLTPSALALHMYVRCNGSRASPVEYFNLRMEEEDRATKGTATS